MFTNLSQNSILYILETKDEPKLVSGTVMSISLPRPQYATFGQTMDSVVDIVATVDGERREFKKVPSSSSIANFGADAFILADSKEAMTAHVNAALQTSKNIVNGYEKHSALIPKYEAVLEELNPVLKADKEKDRAIQDLRDQVSELKQLLIDMTEKGNTKTK
jgi:paraquat-inducible protein B